MDNLGRRIYDARNSLDLTLEAVGQYVGVGKSTVRKWENGTIKNMRRDKIKKLSEILQVSPGYIMGWTDDPSDYGDIPLVKDVNVPIKTEEDLTPFEREVLSRLRLLTEDQQRAFLAYLITLLDMQAP